MFRYAFVLQKQKVTSGFCCCAFTTAAAAGPAAAAARNVARYVGTYSRAIYTFSARLGASLGVRVFGC